MTTISVKITKLAFVDSRKSGFVLAVASPESRYNSALLMTVGFDSAATSCENRNSTLLATE